MDQVDQEQPDNAVGKQYDYVSECRVYFAAAASAVVEPLDRYSLYNCRHESHGVSNTEHNTIFHVADYVGCLRFIPH